MKVLWFTNTPSLYNKNRTGYNGGGWIESLEKEISSLPNIDLAIGFFSSSIKFKTKRNSVTYYPISIHDSLLRKVWKNIFYKNIDEIEINYYLDIIEDFRPDIIHVFGTEKSFGLLSLKTKIPVIIHIQGILEPCLNAYFPPGLSIFDFIRYNIYSPFKIINFLRNHYFFKHNVLREKKIMLNTTYFMGRTNWDKKLSKLMSPNSSYFYCSEMLRSSFYNNIWHDKNKRKNLKLISTISQVSYKGFDLILKSASILKSLYFEFEWTIFGVRNYYFMEKKLGIKSKDVNVLLKGVIDEKELVLNLIKSDVFIHPSYIDNSPNSVCEAQILGMPVISTNVGGISSLINNDIDGILVPANDPYLLASEIISLANSDSKRKELGKNARSSALKRHNKKTIVEDLINIYNQIV